MSNQVYQYNGNDITFLTAKGDVMVNATEMAKSFGKKPAKWLELPSTNSFLKALSKVRKSDFVDYEPIKTIRGGNVSKSSPGTWMHQDVAIEFARWLSPEFAIWCNDHIKNLLTQGKTSMGDLSEDEMILRSMKLLKDRLEITQEENRLQKREIGLLQPKAQYSDKVLQSESLIATTVIAKELGMSAQSLNYKLKQKHVIYSVNGTYALNAKYANMGYAKYKTYTYTDSNNEQKTARHLYWTEKGRKFLHELFNRNLSREVVEVRLNEIS